MASPLLQGKLHISGMDSRAAALARQWQLGLETIAFSYAPLLDDSAALPRAREEIHGISSLWLHGPFAELIPCAIDPLARDVAMRRFRQALDAAQALGIRRMVFHGGFIPHVYFPEWYVEQSVWFWREFLRDVPAGMTLALENVMEPSPETLVSIAAQIDDPRLGLCLDVGHANTCVSETPPMDWIAPMAPWLRHVHLHNNQGDTDLHASLGEGNIPMRQIIDTVLQAAPEATFTIENQDALPSLHWLAAQGYMCPKMDSCRVAVFAADNGVVDEGVSCAPRSVTLQQAINMTRRRTGMSAMAAAFGDDVAVVDVGIAADVPGVGILDRKVRRGTGNIAVEDAMTRTEALAAMAAGMEQAARARADSITALGIGEMGIGNTSTSAAVLSALTGADIEVVTGRGGGLTDEGFARKKDVLRRALTRRAVDKDDVLDVLCAVGGLDIAAMAGAFLGCAHERIPAAVDGFISVVAALCAVTLCPEVQDYLFLSHDSYEVGYRLAADRLGLEPCLHLGMRLGEGSGCPLLFRVLEGACGVMAGMATFAQAAIPDDYLDEIRAGDSFTVDKP